MTEDIGREYEAAPVEGGENRFIKGVMYIFRRSRVAAVGLLAVLIMLLMAVFAPYLAPYDPLAVDLSIRRIPPGSEGHLLGTDHMGRDLLSRVIWGSRISLQVGIVAVGIGIAAGTTLGLIAGFYGGRLGSLIMRVVDVMICFPTLLLALAIIAILGPQITNTMIAVGLTFTPRFARIVRASVLSIREREYVEAARAMGVSNFRILVRHILPNALSGMVVFATLSVGSAILIEASLSFLGLGVPLPTPSWGNIVADGRRFLLPSPWISITPGVVIIFTVMGFNFFGDGLRDALDPRLRGERQLQ
ncbi:MAG: ABC transporter permease [Bacillota bacterium]